ncbi:MAG: hypothetical protein JNM34_06420, partial [Chthonomonadaceae bacterium]|nr:hypothetical protein [Chthonomonadaceae bacterium]
MSSPDQLSELQVAANKVATSLDADVVVLNGPVWDRVLRSLRAVTEAIEKQI